MGDMTCDRCKELIVQEEGSCGTGYGRTADGEIHCYGCCAVVDRESMQKTGRITMFLVRNKVTDSKIRLGANPHYAGPTYDVTNWPGTLRYTVGAFRTSRHNFGCERIDFWFRDGLGQVWHGVNIGDNDIAHCRRTKRTRI